MNNSGAAPWDAGAMENYYQLYYYDASGNLTRIDHHSNHSSYTRNYNYTGNKLDSTTAGVTTNYTYAYGYDSRGNMTSMPHIPSMTYNQQNELWYITLEQGVFNQTAAAGG